jgi:hypothetical protein
VRHVVGLDVDALGCQQRLECLGPFAVRAVPEADRRRPVVEPEAIAAVGEGVTVERAEHRDVEALELLLGVAGLAHPGRLGHVERDAPAPAHDQRVVHVDAVDLAVERVRDLDLDAQAVEQFHEGLVLAFELRRVRCAPAGSVPVTRGRGAPDEDAPQRRDHGGDAVAGARWSRGGHALHRGALAR